MGIVRCVISESKRNIEDQYCASLGHFQKMCNMSPFCPHFLQQESSRFTLYLAIRSGVRYQRCVSLTSSSHRVEQQVAWNVDLHAFSQLSTVYDCPKSDSHLSSGVYLVKVFLFCSRL